MAKVFCGIDWAERHHDIALVDAEGKLVAKRRIADSASGFAELMSVLTESGDSRDDPIPVAIETPRGLLVAARERPAVGSIRSTRWPCPLPGAANGPR